MEIPQKPIKAHQKSYSPAHIIFFCEKPKMYSNLSSMSYVSYVLIQCIYQINVSIKMDVASPNCQVKSNRRRKTQ